MFTLGMQGKKWNIFLTAVKLFSERGYESVSMNEIAEANGIRAASLYNYFASKENILDLIYRFYRENVLLAAPDMESVLSLIPEKSANEILHMSMSYYDDELQPIMDSVYMIAIMQARRNPRAYETIWKYNIEHSKSCLRTVLLRMIELGKIEPMDIESFLELFISFAFTAIFRNPTQNALGLDGWLRGLDLLFSLVKDIPAGV